MVETKTCIANRKVGKKKRGKEAEMHTPRAPSDPAKSLADVVKASVQSVLHEEKVKSDMILINVKDAHQDTNDVSTQQGKRSLPRAELRDAKLREAWQQASARAGLQARDFCVKKAYHQPEKGTDSDPKRLQSTKQNIDGHALDIVEYFTYLGFTIFNKLSLDVEVNRRLGKASATMSERVWLNNHLTTGPKTKVYTACVLSTLFYGSE
ncbi:hypothetical protein CAPTEDRAFT_202532 [Capitella teleta]|uniref:Uncharacterized protein n=1 Tax=Capitella teleta TaxID=283909 RepID=R7V4V9_CAPTE|nr:hypothetical protein CAPTEDRAFT_202532 [Capitella teleta]|eukprot:ELU13888.1 hypothetical protein CAPTEDRAFT_202532 [Capitella teleta]